MAIELYKQPKMKITTTKNTRLVIVSTGVGAIVKTDDEIYILSTIKIYNYFSFAFSVVLKKVELLKMSKVMKLL